MSHAQKGAKGGKGTPKVKKTPAVGKKTEDEREETLQAVVCLSQSNLPITRSNANSRRCLQIRSKPDLFPSP